MKMDSSSVVADATGAAGIAVPGGIICTGASGGGGATGGVGFNGATLGAELPVGKEAGSTRMGEARLPRVVRRGNVCKRWQRADT
jgi:hypothetical protein